MIDIPDEICKLFDKYQEKYKKAPRRFNYDQWDSLEQYKEYLEKELNK